LIFLESYHKDGDEILNHIVRVTGNKTWVSFSNFETKKAVKEVDAITFTEQAENV
jgi:hypothetical protein